jgi:hypothetical protein
MLRGKNNSLRYKALKEIKEKHPNLHLTWKETIGNFLEKVLNARRGSRMALPIILRRTTLNCAFLIFFNVVVAKM